MKKGLNIKMCQKNLFRKHPMKPSNHDYIWDLIKTYIPCIYTYIGFDKHIFVYSTTYLCILITLPVLFLIFVLPYLYNPYCFYTTSLHFCTKPLEKNDLQKRFYAVRWCSLRICTKKLTNWHTAWLGTTNFKQIW